MTDPEFDSRLDRLFAESPQRGDDAAFAATVGRRLDRSWTLRRLVIGGLGVVGGLIGVGQVAASGLVGKTEILSTQSAKLLSIALANDLPGRLFADGPKLGGDALWAALALAAVALGLTLTRSIGDL